MNIENMTDKQLNELIFDIREEQKKRRLKEANSYLDTIRELLQDMEKKNITLTCNGLWVEPHELGVDFMQG